MKQRAIYSIEEMQQISLWGERYAHLSADRVLLGSTDIPQAYRAAVAQQLSLSGSLREKLPSWAAAGVYIPKGINLEQASGELCAHYKACYISPQDTLLDMTGGLGVDFVALASHASRAIYTEQEAETYRAAEYNLPRLLPSGAQYCLTCCNSLEQLPSLLTQHTPTLIYIDPARREGSQTGRRVYAIEDCSPSLHEVLDILDRIGTGTPPRLLVKLSPMLDIRHTLSTLLGIEAIDIVAARGEVKELLLHIRPGMRISDEDIPLRAVDLHPSREPLVWGGTLAEEATSTCPMATSLGRYLYEPSGCVMKSGLYRLLGSSFSLDKLSLHTHLYTSDRLIDGFPGKAYEVLECAPFSSSLIKQIQRQQTRAMVATRHFPLSTDALRSKLRVRDGGEHTIWGVRLGKDEPWLVQCRRIETHPTL